MNIASDAAPSAAGSSCSVTPAPSILRGNVGSRVSLGLTTTSRYGLCPGPRDGAARASLPLTFP
jgi:hypothetical protein